MLRQSTRSGKFRAVVTDNNYNALWRYACRLSKCQADAEDLCQETLTRAFERIEQLREPGAAKTWLFRIMFSIFANQGRRPETRYISLLNDWSEPFEEAPDPDPMVEIIRAELQRLPLLESQAIELFYFDELTLDEIAEVLEVTANTVKQRLFRARARLRNVLSVSCLAEGAENAS